MKNESTYVNNIFKFQFKESKPGDKVISNSQIAMFSTCPKSWYLKYVKKIKKDEASIYLTYGNAMHMLIQYYLKILYTKGQQFANAIDYATSFKNILMEEYSKDYEKNNKVHFSTPVQLAEYYSDGLEIFNYLKKNRGKYFSLKDLQLIGIELPLYYAPDSSNPNVNFMAYLDAVFYDKYYKKYLIIDFKTSKKGWSKWDKENKTKTDQLLHYKNYFAKQFNVPETAIEVEFLIFRQKVDPNSLWPVKRIQSIKPGTGPRLLAAANNKVNDFIKHCFEDNKYIDDETKYIANEGKGGWNCKFCPYSSDETLCNPKNRICVSE